MATPIALETSYKLEWILSSVSDATFTLYNLIEKRRISGTWIGTAFVYMTTFIPNKIGEYVLSWGAFLFGKGVDFSEHSVSLLQEEESELTHLVFQVSKGIIACGLAAGSTFFAARNYQAHSNPAIKAVILSIHSTCLKLLTHPQNSLSIYAPFPSAREIQLHKKNTYHPLASIISSLVSLWGIFQSKSCPILVNTGIFTIRHALNISLRETKDHLV